MDSLTLQRLALEVAELRSPAEVLRNLVTRLAAEPQVALARIWLIEPGDLCATCHFASECPRRQRCLHLVASAGASRSGAPYDSLDGRFRRFPLGVRKVGRIGATGKAERLCLRESGTSWIADLPWSEREGIQTFAGQPLVFRGEILGVLGLFSREVIDPQQHAWLRIFADQAAVSLANARAFAEVERLRAQLELERDYLRDEVSEGRSLGGIVGDSPAIQRVLRQLEVVAQSDATVLIEGESGTGKELVASALHEHSRRAGGPLVRVNCASIPRELFESEFFGHAQGAFSGALRERAGRFQIADGGTLFLDEVGEIPLELQGKLLRALQEGEFSRVGEDRTRRVDVRIVAATNRDLAAEAAAGRFREDLYYRLSVFPLRVPPLRERLEDVPALASHFLARASRRLGVEGARLRRADVRALTGYAWPGNVRELENVIERALILARGGRLQIELQPAPPAPPPERPPLGEESPEVLTDAEVSALARANVVRALEQTGWKISGAGGAAELLDMNPNTLASRLRSLGLRRPPR